MSHCAYRRLCTAVLATAVKQVTGTPSRKRLDGEGPKVHARMREHARLWLTGQTDALLSAELCATAAGYDLDYVQDRLNLSPMGDAHV